MQNEDSTEITQALIDQVLLRLFSECIPRIKKCLNSLTLEQIWWRPNEQSNSIGNLILHLNGNVRQWIISGVGLDTDLRQRATEFSNREKIELVELIEMLILLEKDVRNVLINFDFSQILKTRIVQIYNETPLSIFVHVTEHFSYHTGQIAYIAKMIKGQPLAFYDESKL